jgi:PhzF family phenazine biosynthesis protein
MKLYQVDSFTTERFKGNPAGVCIVDSFPETELMQNVAMEMNVSETAFVEIKNGEYSIRYFTPTVEVPLCGHATLASAHILCELGIENKASEFVLKAKEVDLKISFFDSWIKMNFPTYIIHSVSIPKELNKVLGVKAIEVYRSDNDWNVVLVNSEKEVREAKPEFDKLRFGKYTEDPVTGSANCVLIPFWHMKTNLKKFISKQLSYRTGEIKTELIDDKLDIMGQAKTVMTINLDE